LSRTGPFAGLQTAARRRWEGALADAPSVTVRLAAPIARTFAAVVDAHHYPEWLVGAQHIRQVDPAWPAPGAGFDHVVGAGLLRVEGRTESIEIEPPHHLLLEAGVGWLGSMLVSFDLVEAAADRGADDDPAAARDRSGAPGAGTELTIAERPHRGIVRYLWVLGGAPLLRRVLWGRNRWSVDQLTEQMGLPAPVEA
jgi:uncharacterized protein YndB with AHSA1/START domain